jgi:hypothetical protein
MNRNHHRFGPWATALHYGNRLELTAFWRRRLERLGAVAGRRAPLSWTAAALLCALGAGLILAPRLQVTVALAEEETPRASVGDTQPQTDRTAGPPVEVESPFTAKFSNGVNVQLIGLSENPSKGKPWWAPDGTKLDAPPYARVPAVGHHPMVREICWRWLNVPDDPDIETRWTSEPHCSGAGGGRALDANNKQIEGLTAWMVGFDPAQNTCTVRFSVSIAATPWKTWYSDDGRNPSAFSKNNEGVPQGAIFSPARAENAGTSITISYQLPDRAVRLIAVGKDGLLDRATSTGGGVLEFKQMTYHFTHLTPEKIQRYELQIQERQFETIEFRNVSLRPEMQTHVEIVRLPATVDAK